MTWAEATRHATLDESLVYALGLAAVEQAVVNRRQFLGASLAGIIAALCLPFERFAEWCRSWLKPKHREAFEGVNRELFAGRRLISDPNVPRGKAYYFSGLAWDMPVAYMNPRDFAALQEQLC